MARTDLRTRVGIIGSNRYENKQKIKELIFKLRNSFNGALIIVSGGRLAGTDTYVKKYALEFNCEFKEFNPAYTQCSIYSVLAENYYGKPYSPRYLFHRNSMMVKYVDYLFIFKSDAEKENMDIDSVIKEATKLEKKFIIIS